MSQRIDSTIFNERIHIFLILSEVNTHQRKSDLACRRRRQTLFYLQFRDRIPRFFYDFEAKIFKVSGYFQIFPEISPLPK